MTAYDLLTRWHQLAMSPRYKDAAGILLTREPIVAETKAFLTDSMHKTTQATYAGVVEPVTYEQILTLLRDTVEVDYNNMLDHDSVVTAARKIAAMFGVEVPKTAEELRAEALDNMEAQALEELRDRYPTYESLLEHLGPLSKHIDAVGYEETLKIAAKLFRGRG